MSGSVLAIELNDAEIVARDAQRESLREVNSARVAVNPWVFGRESPDLAYEQMRRWRAQLGADSCALLVSAAWELPQLGLLCGVAEAAGFRIVALVDRAICAAAAVPFEGTILHVDIELERGVITEVDSRLDRCERRRVAVLPELGWRTLRERWLRGFALRMVQDSRFDPLHSAAAEQALHDALSAWLHDIAAGQASGSVSVESGGKPYALTYSAADAAADAADAYAALAAAMHGFRRAGESGAILLANTTRQLPGLGPLLDEFLDCGVWFAQPGLAAATYHVAAADLPFNALQPTLARTVRRRPQRAFAPARAAVPAVDLDAGPTHLVYGSRVIALKTDPVVLGRAPRGDDVLALDERHCAVSRSHCALGLDAGGAYVVDFSRHGTYLNDELVTGRAMLRAGDRLRLGEPAVTLTLVRMA
jgi:hypothetical protein